MQTKKAVLAVTGGAVALVLIAAIVALVQGPSVRPMLSRSGGEAGAVSLGLQTAKRGMVAQGAPSYAMEESVAMDAYAPAPAMMPPQPYPSGGKTAAEVDQKIIKNGSLNLTVDRVSDALGRITAIATGRGGFVQHASSSERGDGKHEGSISIRVPAKEFEAAIEDVKRVATVVNHESTSGQDVTEQYTDLQAQLRNAKAQEEEYLRIMKKAEKVEEILMVQERLGQVRGQIESLEGRMKYLENVTSFSTIQVSLSEERVIEVPTKEFRPGTIVKEAVQTLIILGQQAIAAAIWLGIVGGGVAVPLLVVGLIVLAIVKARRRNQRP